MPEQKLPAGTWLTLILVSASPRLLGAFFLPNAFGDAYVYIRDIGSFSTKISNGSLALTDLFGFWLPLYQLIAAVLNLLIRNGFYSGKIVSALFGAGSCVFVYFITSQLTNSRKAALLIFLLIALNPLHIFYSSSAMTDVPHAFFVLGALYFVLEKKWIVAAIFAALAGLTRVESWMFVALIPFLQLIRERRISPVPVLIMIIPPLFWFYVSWKATGSWLACFQQRQQYLDWLLMMNPAIAHFSLLNVLRDTATLLVSADIAVLIACFMAAWFVVREGLQVRRHAFSERAHTILPPLIFFFAFFALLLVAYLTHQQPIIFPRYGLILFTLGLPVLAWTFLRLKEAKPGWARHFLIAVILICGLDASIQFAGAVGTINQYRAQRAAAEYLQSHFDRNSDAQVFCDEGTVQVLSGIPFERIVTSSEAPGDREAFITFLRGRKVTYMVVANQPGSTPRKLFPELDSGGSVDPFQPVFSSRSKFLPTQIWVYQVRAAP